MGYLVLSRKINQRILIGDAEISISDIRRNSQGEFIADIAIKAPKNIKILKYECHLEDLKNGYRVNNKS